MPSASALSVAPRARRGRLPGAPRIPRDRAAYDRAIGEWLSNGCRLPATGSITIAELVDRYRENVEGRYRSNEPANIRNAIRPVREL